jgi:KRAB domain-containing zinc finger protein
MENRARVFTGGDKPMQCDRKQQRNGLRKTLSVGKLSRGAANKTSEDVSTSDGDDSIVKPLQCKHCNRQFKSVGHLRLHKRFHASVTQKSSTAITAADSVNDGLVEDDDAGRPLECKQCGRSFKQVAHLQLHMRFHIAGKTLDCRYCHRRFAKTYALKCHELIHTGAKPFTCLECGHQFRHSCSLKLHVKKHIAKNGGTDADGTAVGLHQCLVCGKNLAHLGSLKLHMMVHKGEKPHQCTYCGKCFVQQGNFQIHVRRHTGERPFDCKACGKRFIAATDLKRHEKTHVTKMLPSSERRAARASWCRVRSTQCGLCGTEVQNLKRHMMVHNNIRPHACTCCDKRFAQLVNLQSHMRVHTGEKPFVCNVCGKTFTQSSNLKSHQRHHASDAGHS